MAFIPAKLGKGSAKVDEAIEKFVQMQGERPVLAEPREIFKGERRRQKL